MVMINAVAGCETYNLNFFTRNGYAVTADSVDGIVSEAISLLYDDARLAAMSRAMRENFDSNSTYDIYRYIKEGRRND
jgi:processive 1,2-diacylglycerol beta-glucosyltransferase